MTEQVETSSTPAKTLLNFGSVTINPRAKFPDGVVHELHINPKGRVILPAGSTLLDNSITIPTLVVRDIA